MTGSISVNACSGTEDPNWLGEWEKMQTLGHSLVPSRVAGEKQYILGLPVS